MQVVHRLGDILRLVGAALVAPARDPRQLGPIGMQTPRDANQPRLQNQHGLIRRPEDIRNRFTRLEPGGLRKIEDSLASGFKRMRSASGSNALHNLRTQYARLLISARRIERSRIPQVEHIQRLAEEALRHGLASLVDAYELIQVIDSTDGTRLANDIDELTSEIADMETGNRSRDLIRLKQELLQSYSERLQAIQSQETRVQALMNQCERCEAALERASIDLSQLRPESTPESLASTIEALRAIIQRAQQEV
jgi:DNA repair exonuclease SbcCD ATPase subunit